MKPQWQGGVVCLAVLFLSGCATGPRLSPQQMAAIESRLNDQNPPQVLRPLYRLLYMEGERNYVLNAMILAGVAIRHGHDDDAKRVLDEAILRIQAITTGKEAAAARSTFKEEAVKPFKGEPYERVMAYFYRGLLYYRDGEYDNARACFRSAILEDSSSEGEQYRADYASLEYLMGKCSQKLNTPDAADAFARARALLRDGARLPDTGPDNNLLIVAGVGKGPFKYATGQYGEQLRFHEQVTPEVQTQIRVNGQTVAQTVALDNLYFQATTRGGRLMDHVLAGKAVFKDTTAAVGDVGLLAGAGLALAGARGGKYSDELLIAGAAAAAAGLLAKVFSSAAQPAADLRQWNNLPHSIQIASLQLPPGSHRVRVEFLDGRGVQVHGLEKEFTVSIPDDNKEHVLIAHSR